MAHIDGRSGDDVINGTPVNDVIHPGAGNDTVSALAGDDIVNDLINDVGQGSGGDNRLRGGDGRDSMSGGIGDDRLDGGAGIDVLNGGVGSDTLLGCIGDDTFDYNTVSESPPSGGDMVADGGGVVLGGDVFNVSDIDANTQIPNNQAFTFIETDAFSAPGQLRVTNGPGDDTLIQGNVDGVLTADLEIRVGDGSIPPSDYTAGDFVL